MIRIQTSNRKRPVRVFYVCDRKKCEVCSRDCHHTSDIDHALYDDHPEDTFEFRPDHKFGPQKWERIRKTHGNESKV